MTKHEYLDALEAMRSVAEELPEGVDILSGHQEDMGLGCVRKSFHLGGSSIEEAAAVFAVSQIERRSTPAFTKVYFTVGDVSVVQYRDGGGPDAKTT